MAIFMIVPTGDKDSIKRLLKSEDDMPHYILPNGEVLVSYKGTSRELTEHLDIATGNNGPAVIVAISSYFGFASNEIWEWIQTHWEG